MDADLNEKKNMEIGIDKQETKEFLEKNNNLNNINFSHISTKESTAISSETEESFLSNKNNKINMIKEALKSDKVNGGDDIYYILKDAKRFYTYDKGWFGYFKSEKGFEKGDDLIIKIKEGKIYYYINGESLGDPYPIKKSDIDSKNMYLLIHRRDPISQCELKYIYEIFD